MDQIVEELDGVEVIMADVIIAGGGSTHDERLQKFLERASRKGLKLNKEKCRIRQKEVPYVGHLLTAEGLKFLSRYLPRLSTVDAPLKELVKSNVLFHWDHSQRESFKKIKELVSQAPVLQYNDVTKPVTIQCDASGNGLGAVLLQDYKPVCYASRARTDTEMRQFLADTLSRSSVKDDVYKAYEEFQELNVVLSVLDERCEEFQNETKRDPELQSVLTLVKNGWPDTKPEVPIEARPDWTFRDELGIRLMYQRD
ncbi:hypothetical protein ACROYT_G004021 [Oculina patagonica]